MITDWTVAYDAQALGETATCGVCQAVVGTFESITGDMVDAIDKAHFPMHDASWLRWALDQMGETRDGSPPPQPEEQT